MMLIRRNPSSRTDNHTDSERDEALGGPESNTHNRSTSLFNISETHHHHHQDDDDVQLMTLSNFDPSVRVRIGGLVTARSVKYLGNLASKLSDQETRDSWWSELRDEIRSHARILCCSHVIGYLEASTIHEDVAILSITGTACTVRGLPDMTLKDQPRLWDRPWSSLGKRDNGDDIDQADTSDAQTDGKTQSLEPKSRTNRRSDQLDRRMRRAAGGSHAARIKAANPASKDGTADETSFDPISGPKRFTPQKRSRRRVIRARDAKPCSYLHVPYHHRLGPFQNMKL